MKKVLIIGLFSILQTQVFAQRFNQSAEDVKPYPVGIRIDILAKEIDPGVRVGIEYPLSNTLFRVLRDNNDRKEVNKQLLFVPTFSWFTKPGKQNGFLLEAEWLSRKKNERGFFTELGVGVGAAYMSGTYTEKNFLTPAVPSGFFAAPSVSLGLGSDLFQVTDGKYKYLWNIRLHVPVLYPVNKQFFPLYMIQGGIAFYLPKKWTVDQRYQVQSRTGF
ncbi:MAG: hypothetical protein HYZ42_02975 [Bacteroidetes bacterium]|nr:hypothetical protein [Bacteroidota bacterium]